MDGTHPTISPPRRFLSAFALAVCLLLIVHAYALQPFQVPTGSMAPALLGNHRAVDCPRCGFPAVVGRSQADCNGRSCDRSYAGADCPNCGGALPLGSVGQTSGDHVLVAKHIYNWRRPRRWEVVVFQLLGKIFIKRIIGLPGEEIVIEEGDIYADGALVRKTYEQARAMRVLVFDNDYVPGPDGWKERWEGEGTTSALAAGERLNGDSGTLEVDGRAAPRALAYRHFFSGDSKCRPIVDEYGYNSGCRAAPEPVHDFLVECDVEVVEGQGFVAFALTDGDDRVEVEAPVASAQPWTVTGPKSSLNLKNVGPMQLTPGNHYHMEMALVDRRLSFRVDGRDVFDAVDLPPAGRREAVMRPLELKAAGALVRLRHVRLYRDVHYSQAGSNGVHGRSVRLGVDQTFVLGDNSPNSEDSRFWPEQGAVPVANLLGRAILVHLPSRAVDWPQWKARLQVPNWERMRWIR